MPECVFVCENLSGLCKWFFFFFFFFFFISVCEMVLFIDCVVRLCKVRSRNDKA